MTVLVIIDGRAHGSERPHHGLRLAESLAKRDGISVQVFLLGDAVICALPGRTMPAGYYHLDRVLKSIVDQGGKVGCHDRSLNARGISKELLEGLACVSTLEELTDWTLAADKVLVF
jgi:uncharacterized protein involved in oxidation of intracellular sulfur